MSFPELTAVQIEQLIADLFPITKRNDWQEGIGCVARQYLQGGPIFQQYYGNDGESEAVQTLALVKNGDVKAANSKVIWAVAKYCAAGKYRPNNSAENAEDMRLVFAKYA